MAKLPIPWFKMKTPKSKTQPAKAPAAKPGAVKFSLEIFREEFIERPSRELREAMLASPSVFQLTQIAAQLARREDFQDDKPKDAADRARKLWGACADVVKGELEAHLAAVPLILEERSRAETPQEREVRIAIAERKFPLSYENAVKIIVGRKIRLADRHKAFRDFLRDAYAYSGRNYSEAEIESSVEKMLAGCKANGFSKDHLAEAAEWFFKWKDARAKAKAQNAASKRWKKELQKNLLTGSDFAKKSLSIFPPKV